jgi:hypothetical protein
VARLAVAVAAGRPRTLEEAVGLLERLAEEAEQRGVPPVPVALLDLEEGCALPPCCGEGEPVAVVLAESLEEAGRAAREGRLVRLGSDGELEYYCAATERSA